MGSLWIASQAFYCRATAHHDYIIIVKSWTVGLHICDSTVVYCITVLILAVSPAVGITGCTTNTSVLLAPDIHLRPEGHC